ncbi:DJ-1/PfpI family protein [Diaporthe helianthi]|uniref:DJ-1/PfpI family protein n=1 Tax=Diaporthe helianthi TaxID=158607 RepID=A0A2P5HFR2_DIAHE|nr:DJ-1/PfpI family protein [Diaporthe helianthi]
MILGNFCIRGLISLLALADFAITTSALKHRDEAAAPRLKNWGVVLFCAFDGQDIFGPLDALQLLAFQRQMNLYLIAETLDPVTSEPASPAMNSKNSSFWPIILPTHTFANAPELDVLFVPGGAGTRAPDVKSITDFIADRYPSLEYLITVCTGAGLAAKAGVLDGRRATTNKSAWATVTAWGPNVDWVRQARWVVDGNIWTSAGVTAGLDLTFAFMTEMFGYEQSNRIAALMEYIPNRNSSNDPFGASLVP